MVKDIFKTPRFFIYLAGFLLLLLIPKLVSTYVLMLFESALTYAILALAFNLLLRYTGLLSFGHAAYFATGAYTVGMIYKYLPSYYCIEITIPLALLTSFVISATFGFICVRHTRIFFSILALALSMLLFALLLKLYHFTGGSDGIHIPIPRMFGDPPEGIRRFEFLSGSYYYFLALAFTVCTIIMLVIVNSPFGKALQAIRDKEDRAEMIGIRVRRYRWYAFILSGMFAGIAGALWSFVNGHVTPEISDWFFSGEIVFMTLLGGFMVFEGPIIGAILFTFLKLYAMGITQYWMFVMGIILIVLVLLLPGGIAGGFLGTIEHIRSQKHMRAV